MKINIIKQRSLWWTISGSIILCGLIAMAISWTRPDISAPLRPSLDFVGGTRLQLELDCTLYPITVINLSKLLLSEK